MKKYLALALAALMSISMLAGCGGGSTSAPATSTPAASTPGTSTPAEPENVTIRVWSWDGAIQQLEYTAEAYKANHPEVEFVFETISSSTIYDKLTTMLVSGEGLPDVVCLEGEMFATYAAKFPNRFADFTGMVNEADFLASKVAECTIDGKLLGLPWDAAPIMMFYRADIFEEAGVNPDSIVTWEDYIEAGKIIKEKTGKSMSASRFSSDNTMLRAILYSQNATFFDADGNLTVDTPEMEKALQLCQDMYDAGIIDVGVDWSDYIAKLGSGNIATDVQAAWIMGTMMSDCPEGDGKWRAAPAPRFDENSDYVGTNGGSMYAVTATDAAVKAAAMDYLVFTATDVEMNVHGMTDWGLYPSHIPTYSNDVFKETYSYFGDTAPYILVNEEAQKMIPINYTQNYSIANDATKAAVADVTINGADPAAVTKSLQESIEPMMS